MYLLMFFFVHAVPPCFGFFFLNLIVSHTGISCLCNPGCFFSPYTNETRKCDLNTTVNSVRCYEALLPSPAMPSSCALTLGLDAETIWLVMQSQIPKFADFEPPKLFLCQPPPPPDARAPGMAYFVAAAKWVQGFRGAARVVGPYRRVSSGKWYPRNSCDFVLRSFDFGFVAIRSWFQDEAIVLDDKMEKHQKRVSFP